MRKGHRILGLLLFQIAALTAWTYVFREYYIIYHHLRVYYSISLLFLLISLILSVSNHKTLPVLGCTLGVSLFIAVPLAFYPSIVNNPDVIKMLKLTALITHGDFELAKNIDYSAFPGFSYIFGTASIIVGAKLDILFASVLYILLAAILLLSVIVLGKNSKWISIYLLIVFSEGFIYSFNYLSPQLLGQILFILGVSIMIKFKGAEEREYLILLLILYGGLLLTHPESTLMLLSAFLCYSLGTVLANRNLRGVNSVITQVLTFFVMLITYVVFFASMHGPAYILKAPIVHIGYFFRLFLNLLNSENSKIVTSSLIKPEVVYMFEKVNILYNGALLIFTIYLLVKYKKELFTYGALLFSFFISSGIFLVIFGPSFSEFVGRPAFGVSLVVGILTAKYLRDKRDIEKSVSVLFLAVLVLFSFPARVSPQEWNVHVENYYPPIEFIDVHKFPKTNSDDTYYFLYPNVGTSLNQSKYIILPIGQKIYKKGMSSFFGWDANRVMYDIFQKGRHKGTIYSNDLSVVLWNGE
ncbi:hypothetical protein A3L12_02850 [Thermococcus sp. P6]|uniref:hypothetical protein n=1 Tax=Thermococcus sp. P6 TaxID=122420 RepID=UPI000B5A204B|nr:hypothetical protein [Thermococcus sp. P6]ASJ10308.1 hypothetical protein A3L12_02850 [Thermococcus sp. P6]